MLEALKDIDSIIKAVAKARLMNEGHIDGRIVRGIVSEILRQSGERFLAMKQQLSEKDEHIADNPDEAPCRFYGKHLRNIHEPRIGVLGILNYMRWEGKEAIRGDT